MCDESNRVVFENTGGYVEHRVTGERVYFNRTGNAEVGHPQTCPHTVSPIETREEVRQDGSQAEEEEEDRENEKGEDQQSEEDQDMEMDIEFEKEDEQLAKPLTDLGAPTSAELERHFLSHIPFRSRCPHCVAGRARHNAHRKRTSPPEYKVPHVVVDSGFLGGKGDAETLVERDVLSGFLFSHVVPRKGLAHVHGAAVLVDDLKRLGHDTVTPKADNEPAMRSLQK